MSRLVTDGYVQTMQGKGVRNIYQPATQTAFTIGEIETFRETAISRTQRFFCLRSLPSAKASPCTPVFLRGRIFTISSVSTIWTICR